MRGLEGWEDWEEWMEKKQKGTPLMIMLYNVCVFCPAYVTRSTGPAPYTVCDAALYGA